MPNIMLINNDGAGFADYIEIAEGTTVEKLFADRIPTADPRTTSSASIASPSPPTKSCRKAIE